jgi:putative transcriptional regulator
VFSNCRLAVYIAIGGRYMVISYGKLWKPLIDKKMNKTDLKEQSGITYNIFAPLGKCQPVNLESLYNICKCLDHCLPPSYNLNDQRLKTRY